MKVNLKIETSNRISERGVIKSYIMDQPLSMSANHVIKGFNSDIFV